MRRPQIAEVVAVIIAIYLLSEFLHAGFAKLTNAPAMLRLFGSFGYPIWFMYLTGALEIAGAVLVLIPRSAVLGATILICVTIGAIYSHLAHGQAAYIRTPLLLLVLAAVELALRLPSLRRGSRRLAQRR